MAAYEFTFVYPDRDFEESRRFLGSVLGSRPSGLTGVRRHGKTGGTALTVLVVTEAGPEIARKMGFQRVSGIWPAYRPAEVLEEVPGGRGPEPPPAA